MARYIDDNFNSKAAAETYQQNFLSLKEKYLSTPQIVSIETYAKCDAKCNFCPYVDIERIGTRMSDDLIQKITSDIGDLAQNIPLLITMARINEPFLDKRIFDIVRAINRAAPHAQFICFSNGSPLTPAMMENVLALPKSFCLSLSFNDHRAERYQEIMQLPFARTLARFDHIHSLIEAGRMPFWTRISKVADNNEDDEDFIDYVKDRWPLFDRVVYRRSTWFGAVKTQESLVPNVGCHQWYSIGFYADGTDPFCCMDSDGKIRHGDIRNQHLLEIYNHPFKKNLREKLLSRNDVNHCKNCSLLA